MDMEKEEKTIKAVPEPTLRRLPKYINLLNKLKRENVEFISSNLISEELGLDSIQVRKDLSLTGIVGKPKLGFNLDELLNSLHHTLNWDNINDAFLVGAGSLGSALLGYPTFRNYGLNIIAAFDSDLEKLGSQLNGIEILPVEKLTGMIERMHVNIGIITVPADEAQTIAEMMAEGGIHAIWNFAPVHLKVSKEIIVENVQLAQSLGVLTHKLAEKLKTNTI
jgi:redox-sensing transcriptional repressor